MNAGRELDALVAEKVMGHEFCPIHHSLFCCGRGANYSTSIADAWLVVEKMREMGAWMSLSVTGGKTWDVRGIIDERKPTEVRFIAHSESAPEAICLAALRAVEQ